MKSNSIYLLSSQVANILLSIGTTFIILKEISVEDFGILSIWLFFQAFYMTGSNALNPIHLVAINKQEKPPEHQLLLGCFSRATFGFFITSLFLLFHFTNPNFLIPKGHPYSPQVLPILFLLSFQSLLFSFERNYLLYLQSKESFRLYSFINSCSRLLKLTLLVIFITIDQLSLFQILLASLLAQSYVLIPILLVFSKNFFNLFKEVQIVLQQLKESIVLWFGELLLLAGNKLNLLWLTALFGSHSSGIWGVVDTLMGFLFILPQVLLIQISPKIIREESYPKALHNKIILFFTSLLIIAGTLVPILFEWFNLDKYLVSGEIFLWTLPGLLFWAYTLSPTVLLHAKGKSKWISLLECFQLIALIVANSFLIEPYGLHGAAISFCIARFIYWICFQYLWKRSS